MANDPWSDARRAAERKAEQAKAGQEVIARDARIATSKAKREAPKFDKPYPWPKPFWS